MIAPTPAQQRLLTFITDYIAEKGTAPTVREMKEGIGSKSLGSVHQMLCGLEHRGHIRRLPRTDRAIEIVGRASHLSDTELLDEVAKRGLRMAA
ncbi:LexA family protein [Qipengyuania atrilutea]|uniref:LexA repressor DNA-binding domain-containing protein n=1 Tax=Qipengyuania atrilutea TaxID=2744473 RepID=A0A850H174_9SPHN|nr:hypothetical protein [Actirhodobacter atriluteus]NVD44367.1 hypothetical protein [Actirhodobacter atriluteus]